MKYRIKPDNYAGWEIQRRIFGIWFQINYRGSIKGTNTSSTIAGAKTKARRAHKYILDQKVKKILKTKIDIEVLDRPYSNQY